MYNQFADNKDKVCCGKDNHETMKDCLNSWNIANKQIDENTTCQTDRLLFYTSRIRRNINVKKNYDCFCKDLAILLDSHPMYPFNCRMIASFLTNILQASPDAMERGYAMSLNMMLTFEKLHLKFTNVHEKCYINDKWDSLIFENFHLRLGDLYRNALIRDFRKMVKNYALLTKLYKRAMLLLKMEPHSILHSVYANNASTRKAIDNLIKNHDS